MTEAGKCECGAAVKTPARKKLRKLMSTEADKKTGLRVISGHSYEQTRIGSFKLVRVSCGECATA